MSEFINTIDALGDDAVIDGILNGTITEFCDDTINKIGQNALFGCTKLLTIDIPNVTSLGASSLNKSGTSTTKLHIPKVTSYGWGAISNAYFGEIKLEGIGNINASVIQSCSKLKSLILSRTDKIISLVGTSQLSGTPIASGTGYIYVPSSLVATYQTATNWSTYAAQFRALEDYTVDGTITGELDESKI